jgi:hypothetical protein
VTEDGTSGAEPPRYDRGEVQAFTESGRWLLGLHDKRSETLGQRATTLLGFISATVALLPAGFTLGRDAIKFTGLVKVNVVLVLVLLVVAAGCCFRTLAVRRATVPSGARLREQWTRYATGGDRDLVHGQIAHSLLGGTQDEDPIASSAAEATSRANALRWALRSVGGAVILMAILTAQILKQQV